MMWKVWIGIKYAPYCFSWSSVKFQGHTGQKIANFYPNGVRFWTSCNSSLNTIMATNDAQSFKRYTRGAILFFKVIRQISRSHRATICNIFYPNWVFPDCTSGLNSLMVTNDAQSFKGHTRGAIFFFKVICQISRSPGPKKRQFDSDLSVSRKQLQFEFMDG